MVQPSIALTSNKRRPSEGPSRINAAAERLTSSTAEVANLAASFFEEWGAELTVAMADPNPTFGPDLDELIRAIQGREEAQEAFARTFAEC